MSKLKRFREELIKRGFDGALISSKVNQIYLSSFNFDDGFVVVTKRSAYVMTDSRYEEVAHKVLDQNPDFSIVLPKKRMFAEIADILKNDGCTRIAFEESELTVAMFDRFADAVRAELGDDAIDVKESGIANAILDELRITKDEGEIELIKKAQAITDAAFDHVLGVLSTDMTEIDVALELENFMRKSGSDGLAFDTIAVNAENSSLPHGVPSTAKLKNGFLTMDFGAKYQGYCSDMTRTVCIGKADEDMKRLYNTVLDAQRMAIEAAEYGMLCKDIDTIARDHINNSGYKGYFGHGLGHGVGLYIHESPRLSPGAGDVRLTAGHVVTVEPGIYLPGRYGCRIEDMIICMPDKSVVDITNSPKQLIEI